MKKKIGFSIPTKENEKRRALLPKELSSDNTSLNRNEYLYIEEGYGKVLEISDSEYSKIVDKRIYKFQNRTDKR